MVTAGILPVIRYVSMARLVIAGSSSRSLGRCRTRSSCLGDMAEDRVAAAELRSLGGVAIHVSLQEIPPYKGPGAVWVLAVVNLL